MRASNEVIVAEFLRRFRQSLDQTQLIEAHRLVIAELAANELKETLDALHKRGAIADSSFAKGALDSTTPNRGMDSPWSVGRPGNSLNYRKKPGDRDYPPGPPPSAGRPKLLPYDFDLDEEDTPS